jgi:endonuclease/exonuclease/phosphatase family metal-dependent hydrolase
VSDAPDGVLRLVSYNVHDLLDDREAVTHVLRSLRCDVACLQEVPRRWFERHRVSRPARDSGLRWASGGRSSGGTAVLVGRRVDLVDASAYRLPVQGRFTRRRGAATATVELGGRVLTAVSVHLPLHAPERVTHARFVRARQAADAAGPAVPTSLVLAGDLNEPPGGPAWQVLGAGRADALESVGAARPPFTARRPRRRIDAVLVSAGVTVLGAPDPATLDVTDADLVAASDHLPVVVDLRLSRR